MCFFAKRLNYKLKTMNKFQEIKTNVSQILSESTAYGLPKVF
jgi:hypothetical protein